MSAAWQEARQLEITNGFRACAVKRLPSDLIHRCRQWVEAALRHGLSRPEAARVLGQLTQAWRRR